MSESKPGVPIQDPPEVTRSLFWPAEQQLYTGHRPGLSFKKVPIDLRHITCPVHAFSTTVTHSPLSQFFPPNPSGQSQLKEPHRLTQVPPFRHGLLLQKCLFAEHPGTSRGGEGGEAHLIASSGFPHYFIKAENSWSIISRSWQVLLSFPLLCSFYFCFFPLTVFHLNWLFERTDIILLTH